MLLGLRRLAPDGQFERDGQCRLRPRRCSSPAGLVLQVLARQQRIPGRAAHGCQQSSGACKSSRRSKPRALQIRRKLPRSLLFPRRSPKRRRTRRPAARAKKVPAQTTVVGNAADQASSAPAPALEPAAKATSSDTWQLAAAVHGSVAQGSMAETGSARRLAARQSSFAQQVNPRRKVKTAQSMQLSSALQYCSANPGWQCIR